MNPETNDSTRTRLVPRVGVCSISSSLEIGADRAPQAAADLERRLTEVGCEVITAGPIGTPDESVAAGCKFNEKQVDAIAVSPASWCEDYLVTDLIEECSAPITFWPLPGMAPRSPCPVGRRSRRCWGPRTDHADGLVINISQAHGCPNIAPPPRPIIDKNNAPAV